MVSLFTVILVWYGVVAMPSATPMRKSMLSRYITSQGTTSHRVHPTHAITWWYKKRSSLLAPQVVYKKWRFLIGWKVSNEKLGFNAAIIIIWMPSTYSPFMYCRIVPDRLASVNEKPVVIGCKISNKNLGYNTVQPFIARNPALNPFHEISKVWLICV